MPLAITFAAAALREEKTAIGDSAIHSALLTEVVPAQHLAAAYSLRSILGFGMGALSPWLFGALLDAAAETPPLAWGLAWSMLGTVALSGSWLTWRAGKHARSG